MSKQQQNCESVCPQCDREVKFIEIHPLKPDNDCFLGSYICECEVTLMMDYEVASQTVVARELSNWRAHKAAELDNHAVDQLSNLMKQKLAKKREQGYNGWPNCDPNHLSRLLRDHVEKGDPVDVANFCAFLVANGDSILPISEMTDEL